MPFGTTRFLTRLAVLTIAGVGCASPPPPVTKIVGDKVIVTRAVSARAYEHATRALLFEREERWEDAAAEYQRALSYDGDAPELHARLAEVFLELDRVADAAEAVKRSLDLGVTVLGLMAKAHLASREGKPHDAVIALEIALGEASFDDDPEDAERVHLELSYARLAVLDLPGAAAALDALVASAPWSLEGRMRGAALAWAVGDVVRAERRLLDALKLEPGHIDGQVQLAWLRAALGRNDEARRAFEEALERSERSLDVASAFARFLVGRGEIGAARELADDLAGPDVDESTVADRMELERTVKRPERALAVAQSLRKLTPSDALKDRLPLAEAYVLEDAGRHDEAVAAYLSVPQSAEGFRRSRLEAASILREQGQAERARKVIEEAASDAADEQLIVEVAIARALIDEAAGDAARAARRLEEAALGREQNVRLTLARAALEERRGDWRRALTMAEAILARDPNQAEALNFWGYTAAEHDHELATALKRLEAALALEPGSAAILDSVGWAHVRSGNLPRAALFIEQASRLAPDDAEILGHLASLYERQQDKPRAVATLRRALAQKAEPRVKRRLEEELRRLEAQSAAGR